MNGARVASPDDRTGAAGSVRGAPSVAPSSTSASAGAGESPRQGAGSLLERLGRRRLSGSTTGRSSSSAASSAAFSAWAWASTWATSAAVRRRLAGFASTGTGQAPPLSLPCGDPSWAIFGVLALLALPAHPYRRHLVALQGRHVAAHEDVHVLEHVRGLRRDRTPPRVVHSRLDHSSLHQLRADARCTMPLAKRGPAHPPPSPAASQLARRSRRRAGPAGAALLSPRPAGPPCPWCAGWRLRPRPHTSIFLPADPPYRVDADRHVAGAVSQADQAQSPVIPGRGPLRRLPHRELGEERHQLIGRLGAHPRDLRDVLALEVEDVVQHLVAGALQNAGELGDNPWSSERHLQGNLLFRRQRRRADPRRRAPTTRGWSRGRSSTR